MMARQGYDVTLHARGPHLRAMQEKGVRVISADDDFVARPRLVADLKDAGTMDVVFLCVKAHGLPPLAAQLAPVLGPETAVVSTQNGIPWWYYYRHGGARDGLQIPAIDPDGVVLIRGARWRARTNRATPIEEGAVVRVIAVDGASLEVEPETGGARDHRERRRGS